MKRKNLKNTALHLASLLVLLFGMNLLYTKLFFEKDLQKYSPIINLVREVPLDAHIIYLGESSNNSFRKDDLDKRKISDFIADYYPDLVMKDLTKPAAHSGIFKVLLAHIPDECEEKTVVVTLTLRSFSRSGFIPRLKLHFRRAWFYLNLFLHWQIGFYYPSRPMR